MGADTTIEWADHTFNPWIGCTAVSPACDHCYAETLATQRLGVAWGPHAQRRRTAESTWRQPLAWNRKAAKEGRRFRVFCSSLADVFDNQVPAEWREDLWALIHDTPNLDWLLLTKRPQNIGKMLPGSDGTYAGQYQRDVWGGGWPNVWLGTTVENQAEAERRIPHLLAVPAAVRFLSCEPLLGPVDLRQIVLRRDGARPNALSSQLGDYVQPLTGCFSNSPRIDWIIAGGESGPKARPSHPDWFRSLRDQCQAAGVPFFFKQWGEWAPAEAFGVQQEGPVTDRHGNVRDWMRRYVVCKERADRITAHSFTEHTTNLAYRAGKKRAGATLDGREWREVANG